MNRNESFPSLTVTSIAVHLAWASLDILVDDVEDIQVLVSGSDDDVSGLRLQCQEGKLLLEQPTYGLNIRQLGNERWMQVVFRLPRAWKGAVDADTITGPMKAQGVTGTDLTLDTVSGDLRATGLTSMTTALRSVSGSITADNLIGEKLSLRTVSGSIAASRCGYDAYKLNSVAGNIALSMIQAFDKLDGTTVSGGVRVTAPIDRADAALRSVSGRLRTQGVSIQAGSPKAYVSSVSGDFEINCSLQAATYEEE